MVLREEGRGFFRTSRSIRSSRLSLRRRASSARSSVVSPVLPLVRSARACFTHCARVDGVRSSSRATAPTVLPSSKTSRTAPILNSSLNCRRARLPPFVDPILDIVSTFRKMSTKPDQTHAGVDSPRGWLVVASATGGSHGHCRVRYERASARSFRQIRGSGGRRRVSVLGARQLDQRGFHRRRRVPEQSLLTAEGSVVHGYPRQNDRERHAGPERVGDQRVSHQTHDRRDEYRRDDGITEHFIRAW